MTTRIPASSARARQRMQAVRQHGTAPEQAVAEALTARGIEFRTQTTLLSGMRRKVDFALDRWRVAILIDGCFWHGCPLHATQPRANAEAWRRKLAANRQRDADTDRRLREADWIVLRFWEHEPAAQVADAVAALLRDLAIDAAEL